MYRYRVTALCGFLIAVVFGQGALYADGLEAARSFTPRWAVGDRWRVRTEHRRYNVADAAQAKGFAPPLTWLFRVTNVEPVTGGTRTTLAVSPEHGDLPRATLCFMTTTTGCHLQSVRSTFAVRGTTRTRQLNFAPGKPALSEAVFVPADMPVFPLRRAARLGGPGLVTAAPSKTYRCCESVGGLTFATDVTQSGPSLGGAAFTDGAGHPVRFDVAVSAAMVYPVVIAEAGRRAIRQFWAEGKPWFLYAENHGTRSWLLP